MSLKALLLDVKRFAVHDGPGIRTTLFLKGCPLKCRWCHNPESTSPEQELAYYEHKCIQCGECVSVCPVHAHTLIDGKHFFDRSKCIACGACEDVCLGRALKLFGREVTVEDACKIVIVDCDFYEPDGGVTVSGGEPLLHAKFCAELFKCLKECGIHCAIDTCGTVSWEKFSEVLPYTDLFLYDLKHVDEELHIEYTGSSNKLIFENLEKLDRCHVPIEIRIPLIPGFNMDADSINAMGEKLRQLSSLTVVRLLAYHNFAGSKYEAVGQTNTMPKVTLPSSELLHNIADALRKFCLIVK